MGIFDRLFGHQTKQARKVAPPGRDPTPPPKAMIQIDEQSVYTYYVPEGTQVGDVLEVPWGRPREEWVPGMVVALGTVPWPEYPGGPKRPAYTGRCRYARRPVADTEEGSR